MDRHDQEQFHTSAVSEDYSLEDIMKEFGTPEQAPPAPTPEPEPEPEVIKIVPTAKPKPVKSVSDDTMVFQPIRTPVPMPDPDAPMKIASDGKLPKASQKTAPQKAEAKRKIEIKESEPLQEQLKKARQGLTGQHIRALFAPLVALLAFFVLLYHENEWTFLPFVKDLGFILPLLLLCAVILLTYDVFLKAAEDLLRLRIGLHTLSCIAAVLALVQAVISANTEPQTYCAIAAILLSAQLRALHNERSSQFHILRTISSFEAPMGIYDTPKLLKNADSLRRKNGNVTDFFEKLENKNTPHKVLRIYATVMFILLPLIAYLLSVGGKITLIKAWLLLLFGAVPCGAAAVYVRPFASICKRLAKYSGALCGWFGGKIFGGKHTIVLSDEDLFPKKNITSNGMKLYGAHKAPRIIAYALAALKIVESPLVDLFQSLLESQYGKPLSATQHRIYNDGGIGAEISGDIVLVGSLSFMRSMGVHMPAGTRVRQAVYVAVGGELAGIFAVKYRPSSSTKAGLRDILANHNFSVILATKDFLISPEMIAAKYDLPTDSMQCPDYSERLRLCDSASEETARQGALIAKDTFGAFAVTVASGRTLRMCTLSCLVLNLLVGMMGLLLCIALIAWNATTVASALHIALFQLLWSFLSGLISFIILKT